MKKIIKIYVSELGWYYNNSENAKPECNYESIECDVASNAYICTRKNTLEVINDNDVRSVVFEDTHKTEKMIRELATVGNARKHNMLGVTAVANLQQN